MFTMIVTFARITAVALNLSKPPEPNHICRCISQGLDCSLIKFGGEAGVFIVKITFMILSGGQYPYSKVKLGNEVRTCAFDARHEFCMQEVIHDDRPEKYHI